MGTSRFEFAAPEIVLIHGLWVTALSWEHWIERYSAGGYHVIARGWPGMDVSIEELRRDPTAVANIGVTEIVDHFDRIIRESVQPPILIGHSFGGLVVQILLDRGLGAAGVAIDPAPVKGILNLPLSTLRVSFPVLRNPANVHRATELTREQFHYAFTNTLTEEEASQIYDKYEAPGPGRVLFQAGLANFNPHAATRVNFKNNDRAPLLLISGGKDHIAPASLTRANYELFNGSKAITELKEFPERSHFTIGEPGWEAVADYALEWALKNAAEWAGIRPSLRTTETMASLPSRDSRPEVPPSV